MADKISGNVVQIQNYAGSTKKPGPSYSSPMLQDCRNTVLERSSDALARAMDNIDDTLFALADKANNNTIQSHYFNAMREIRIIRKDMESLFKESYKEEFDEIIRKKSPPQIPGKSPSLSETGLSLVEDGNLEEKLAINALIEKISSVCHNEIYGLDKRISLLLGKKELETEDNPIGPKIICTALNTACSRIKSGVDIKLIVFKLIDRYICETIQQVYRDINNHLAMSGILPELPTPIGKGNAIHGAILNNVVVGRGGEGVSQLFNKGGVSSGGAVPPGGTAQSVSGISGLRSQSAQGKFEPALAELENRLENHQVHFDENVEEARKLIQGRGRLMIAESMVVDEIERRLEDKPSPQFIRNFAMECWKNLLIVIYMKEDQKSDAWKSKLEILDQLIWSTLPKSTLKDRKKLVGMLPTLLTGIKEGMKMMSLEPSEQRQFMEKLSNCHTRLVNPETQFSEIMDEKEQVMFMNNKAHTLPMASQQTKKTKTPPAESSATIDTAKKQLHNLGSIRVEEIRVLGEDNTAKLNNNQNNSPERLDVRLNLFGEGSTNNFKNIEAGITKEQRQETGVIKDEWTELVRSMVPGIWFEFRQKDGPSSMERLAWISSALGSYLFTNHDGLKTRELSTQELEKCLRTGRAILADDLSFLVDSSFNTLRGDTQKKLA